DRPVAGRDEASRTRALRVPFAGRRRVLAVAQAVLLVGAVAAAAYLSTADQWEPAPLVGLITLLVLGSDILVLDAKRFRISGFFTVLWLTTSPLRPAATVAVA